ncbi:MAG: NHL repeat-containing protein [Candidatus Binatia bacterium]
MEAKQPTLSDLSRYVLQRQPWAKVGAANVLVFRRAAPGESHARRVQIPTALSAVLPIADTRVLGEGWLVEPRGIAAAGDHVAVADTALSHIVIFSAGALTQTVGTQELLREPEAVAWGLHGDLYIADTWQHRVLTLALQTFVSRPVFALSDGWYGPRGIAIHHDGRVAITDTGHKRIVISEPTMADVRVIGGTGKLPGLLDEPVGITWVGDYLLVADTGNRRLQLFDTNGQVQRIVPLPDAWPDYYSRPQVVAIRDNLWLATDLPNGGLWFIEGAQPRFVRLSTPDIQPSGLAWDAHTNTLYLSDLGGRLWQFHLTGTRDAPEESHQPTALPLTSGKGETKSDLHQ